MNPYARSAARTPMLPINERELEVLRVLGRMGAVLGTTLSNLITPDLHIVTSRRLWQRLTDRKLIWQASVPNGHTDAAGRVRGRPLHVYGLTDDGRAYIDNLGAEPHDGTFERLIYRPKQSPSAPNADNLTHETYISDWCATLLDQVRRTPMLVGVHVQRRYAITDASGATVQTLGAVIVLAFDPKQTTFDRPCWALPWIGQGAIAPSWTVVRLALEVDGGKTPERSIFDLAQTYRTLTQAGGYRAAPLGGAPRPVLIAPQGRRANAVADMWMEAWPGSLALVSMARRVYHPLYGVLWGQYLSLKTTPVQPANLLGNLFGTVDEWPTRTSGWRAEKAQ